MKTFITTAFLFAAIVCSRAQEWTRIGTLPISQFTALEVIGETIFTASSNTLYYSSDNGAHWQQTMIAIGNIHVSCIAKFGNTLYIGTSGSGIYSVAFDNLSGPVSHPKNGVYVTSFAEKNNIFYASTDGQGIYQRGSSGQWNYFMNGMPNYSNNVSKIVSTPNSLIATAGGNGTFYRYDFADSQWHEYTFYPSYAVGMSVNDAVLAGSTMYVSNYKKLLRSDDLGEHWFEDQQGLVNGIDRYLYKGQNSIYTITEMFAGDENYNYTYLMKRNISAAPQSSWNTASEVLPFYTYALREQGNTIFAATNIGLYFKIDNTLSTVNLSGEKSIAGVYPNPSSGAFMVESNEPVEELHVYDLSGKLVYTASNVSRHYEFTIDAKGIYILKATTGESTEAFKLIVK